MRHLLVLLAASIAATLSGTAVAQDRPAMETTKVEGSDGFVTSYPGIWIAEAVTDPAA